MTDRKLTIAIPVFERFDYFEEALMSAVNQTISVDIIVVDNASSHNKFEVFIKSLNLKNVTYFRNDLNLGMYGNWNRCIELCQSEFVTILCDDDILENEYTAFFYKRLVEFPNMDCYHTGLSRFGNLYVEDKKHIYKRIIGYHTGIDLLQHGAKFGLSTIETNTIAFRASIFKDIRYNTTSNSYNADYLFCYLAFIDGFLYGEDKSLLKLRIHETSGGIVSGNLPYLSCSYVFNQIKLKLKALNFVELKEAELKEKNILRNAIIRDVNIKADIVKITTNPNDVFGIQIKKLIDNDLLSRLAINYDGLVNKLIVFYFRVIRKIQSL
ncbi:glycosyltransferase family 2 protein [Flavobacterium sp. RSP29]|uniref:glycosyltransferase family 2 protein n=1 Tax=Flavobacterium sp. RSP29 TaxID=3401731 RepID=UPI003AAAC3C7